MDQVSNVLRTPDAAFAELIDYPFEPHLLTTTTLTETEMAAYDAPFPDSRYAAAPRKMPQIAAADL